jgi:hypothetical protein
MQMRPTKNALGWDMTFRDEPPRPVRTDRRACAASPRRRERRLRRLRRRKSRAQARQSRRLPRRSLYLRGGERARRAETRRLQDAGRGRSDRRRAAIHWAESEHKVPALGSERCENSLQTLRLELAKGVL